MTRIANAFLLATLLLLSTGVLAGHALAETASQSPLQLPESQGQGEIDQDILKRQAKAANLKRHSDLKRDADRLLQLATELKLQVDKSNEHILSLTVIQKAEEIEKLARSVKQKMKAE